MTPFTSWPGNQKGATVFGGLIIVLLIAAVTLVVMKLTPAYVENYNIKRVLGDLSSDTSVAQMSSAEIRRTLTERLRVSGVHDRKSKTISVKSQGGATQIDIKYVVKKHLVANVDLLLSFHDTAKIERR